MTERPALDRWLAAADDLLDEGPVLLGRRLAVVPQERGRHVELRYGALLGDEYLQLVEVDPTTGTHEHSVLVRRGALDELARHLRQLCGFLDGTSR